MLGQAANRLSLLKKLKTAGTNEIVAQNALEFFHMLGPTLEGRLDFNGDALDRLKVDHEFILAVWNAATSFPIQPRALGSLLKTAGSVMRTAGIKELPRKEWMPVSQPEEQSNEQEEE